VSCLVVSCRDLLSYLGLGLALGFLLLVGFFMFTIVVVRLRGADGGGGGGIHDSINVMFSFLASFNTTYA
jgi:hypothetical protein